MEEAASPQQVDKTDNVTGEDKEWIRSVIKSSGAVSVGFAKSEKVDGGVMAQCKGWIEGGNHAGMEYLRNHAALKSNPDFVLPGASTVVSMAFSYAPKEFRDESLPRIACYAYGDDYHDVIRRRLVPIIEVLREKLGGEWRVCIDSAPISERYWALKSGIGIKGKNGSIIVEGAGGYVFLSEIVTTISIPPDVPSTRECKKCGACQRACPQKALLGDGCVDSRRCLNYLTIEHRGEWEDELAAHMQTCAAKNTLYGCDICLRVCPYNNEVVPTGITEFKGRPQIMSLTAETVVSLSQERFSSLFKGSPIKRAKLVGLRRNALNIILKTGSSAGRESQ